MQNLFYFICFVDDLEVDFQFTYSVATLTQSTDIPATQLQ